MACCLFHFAGCLTAFLNQVTVSCHRPEAAIYRMRFQKVIAALLFAAPFAVLLVLWAVLVPYFEVNPRLFPSLGSVARAGIETIEDGTLFAHIGASLLRVLVGTILALV